MVPQGEGVVVMVSAVDCTGKVTVLDGVKEGPEKGVTPVNPAGRPRVSTRRQGVTATKVRALADAWVAKGRIPGPAFPAVSLPTWLGCQCSGAAQFFRGTASFCAVCPVNATGRKSRGKNTRREKARLECFECIT